jgi:hypothetical protein
MRKLLGFIAAAALLLIAFMLVFMAENKYGRERSSSTRVLKAGFTRVNITPPVGTRMTGFGARDLDPNGCRGIHDDLFVRALYLSQGKKEILVMGFDLLFFSRDEADRFRGAISRQMDIPASSILLNTSHTHTGPKVGSWFYTPSDHLYLDFIESAMVEAALEARDNAREATLWAGEGKTGLPMSRRLPEKGIIEFRPNPKGVVYSHLPVIYLKDQVGKPICLLFSVACHPSTVKGVDRSWEISADFPGAAMTRIDEWLGAPASMFLQGTGGDAKASVIGKGEKDWRAGTWADVDSAGAMVSEEVKGVVERKLMRFIPKLEASAISMKWPLTKPLAEEGYRKVIDNPSTNPESSPEIMKIWAEEKLAILKRGWQLPSEVDITLHGIQLGTNLRIVGIEGEAVAELGLLVRNFYKRGVTMPLGYTDGAQMYLPTTKMLSEGGYEVESYWEYRIPSPLAGGMEQILASSLTELRKKGID